MFAYTWLFAYVYYMLKIWFISDKKHCAFIQIWVKFRLLYNPILYKPRSNQYFMMLNLTHPKVDFYSRLGRGPFDVSSYKSHETTMPGGGLSNHRMHVETI